MSESVRFVEPVTTYRVGPGVTDSAETRTGPATESIV